MDAHISAEIKILRNMAQGQQNNGPSRFKKIKLRTMDSDKKSIQEQGGGAPEPYSPGEGGGGQNPPFTPGQGGGQGAPKPPQNIPSQGGGSGAFQNAGDSQFPPKPSSMPGGDEPPKEGGGGVKPIGPEMPAGKKNKPGKKLFISLLVVILVAGILSAGYFFVYPMLKGGGDEIGEEPAAATTEETTELEEEATTTEEEEFGVPMIPAGGEEEATTTEEEEEVITEEEEEAEPSAGEISADAHVSLFSTPADSTVEKELGAMEVASVKSALEISPTDVPLFREVVLTDEEGNIIRSEELLGVIAPNTFSEEVRQSFNADPTLFTYTDDSGTWFGLALQAKSATNLEGLKTSISGIENNVSEVKNFFLTGPGDETSWKDGGSGDVTSRYLSFSEEGASFNYGWSNDVLLISGSYSAFGEAVNKL